MVVAPVPPAPSEILDIEDAINTDPKVRLECERESQRQELSLPGALTAVEMLFDTCSNNCADHTCQATNLQNLNQGNSAVTHVASLLASHNLLWLLMSVVSC
ncbi:hypothetical protein C8J29_104349 [Cereibacter johrii]|uniref:Uncharacterized protein n=1 Tax=Cereibacter johrii TaxID=445629 RepID=A0ABX5J9C5_9RHOB|nr:hypothetical protein C8J29_104349 [Cereibacter johrii]